MAAKKKNSKKKKQPDSRQKIMGVDANKLGMAIAGAIAGELAQLALNRISDNNTGSHQIDRAGSAAQNATGNLKETAQNAVSAVKDALLDGKPSSIRETIDSAKRVVEGGTSIEDVRDIVKVAFEKAKPILVNAINTLQENTEALPNSARDTLEDALEAGEDVLTDAEEITADQIEAALEATKEALKWVRSNLKKASKTS